jgi:hypothetical protein
MTAVHPILAWCRGRSEEMSRLLEELVAIESPSTEPLAQPMQPPIPNPKSKIQNPKSYGGYTRPFP